MVKFDGSLEEKYRISKVWYEIKMIKSISGSMNKTQKEIFNGKTFPGSEHLEWWSLKYLVGNTRCERQMSNIFERAA